MNQTAVINKSSQQQDMLSARRTEQEGNDFVPSLTSSFDISRIPLGRGMERVQPKLRINTPGDRYEQEADRIADQILRMPEPQVQRQCSACEDEEEQIQMKPVQSDITPVIQRKCKECEEEEEELQMKPLSTQITQVVLRKCAECEEEEEEVQMKENGSERSEATSSLAREINQTKGHGRPMDGSTTQFISSRLGRDLSDVRIHTGTRAARMNREINARAFTVGKDIYFNQGQYAPGTTEGRRLLAHEVVHTVQQNSVDNLLTSDSISIQRQVSSSICYQDSVEIPESGTCHPLEPENCPMYEHWISSFTTLRTFQSDDTVAGGTRGRHFEVIGQIASREPNAAENERAETQMVGRRTRDQFVDHPTQRWVETCLPENLRATAYQLPSDCADIAVILRHVWLSAHRRQETYGGYTVGDYRGRSRQQRVHTAIRGIGSWNIDRMVNAYSDSRGNRIRSYEELQHLLHPGDILVWEHHEGSGPVGRRTGGHTQTILSINREGGRIKSISYLQGNQPIFSDSAAEIRETLSSRNPRPRVIPSSSNLRNAPGRRIEVSRDEAQNPNSELLSITDLQDITVTRQVNGRSETTSIWTWADGHTSLVAAGPPKSARRPRSSSRGGQRSRNIMDWRRSFSGVNRRSYQGTLEAMLLEARSLLERDQSVPENQISEEQAENIGRIAGEAFRRVYRRVWRNSSTRDEYFNSLEQTQQLIHSFSLSGNSTFVRPKLQLIRRAFILGAGISIEESRLQNRSGVPQEQIASGDTNSILDRFRNDLDSARSLSSARSIVRQAGINLWQHFTSRASSYQAEDIDDRPLYWTRLQLIRDLRNFSPRRFRLNSNNRQSLIQILEETSRGRTDIRFDDQRNVRRILITGFDPFNLDNDIRTMNPSGSVALALDGETISIEQCSAQIESAVFPVRYSDFNDNVVENMILPQLRHPDGIDMIMTISLDPSAMNFEIERFAGRRRSSTSPDNEGVVAGSYSNPNEITNLPQNINSEFLPTSLPGHLLAAQNSRVVQDYSQDRTNTGEARSGSGGGYLSNEIFYRVRAVTLGNNSFLPVGHLHTPSLEFMSAADIVKNTRQILRTSLQSLCYDEIYPEES